MGNVFVIIRTTGAYSDREETPIAYCTTEAQAQEFVTEAERVVSIVLAEEPKHPNVGIQTRLRMEYLLAIKSRGQISNIDPELTASRLADCCVRYYYAEVGPAPQVK